MVSPTRLINFDLLKLTAQICSHKIHKVSVIKNTTFIFPHYREGKMASFNFKSMLSVYLNEFLL